MPARRLLDNAGLAYKYLEYGSYFGGYRRRLGAGSEAAKARQRTDLPRFRAQPAIVEKVFRLNYERYKLACPRPMGMGPFFDFAAAAARRQKLAPKSSLGKFGHKAAPALPADVDDSEGRWYGEGGNTQTHVARRAYKLL